MTRILFTLLVLFITSSCAPIPHFYYKSPKIKGTVTLHGESVSTIDVRLIDPFEEIVVRKTETDSDGVFEFSAVKELQFLMIFLAEGFYWTEIDIIYQSDTYKALSTSSTGYSPRNIELSCELDDRDTSNSQNSFCKFVKRD